MSRWRFPAATTFMEKSTELLESRDSLSSTLEPLDLEVPDALETAYETGAEDLDDVEKAMESYIAAADELVSADEAVDASRSVWEKIGLQGSDVDGKLADAEASFTDGEVDAAKVGAEDVQELMADADAEGKKRAGIGAVAVVALAGVTVLGRRTLRRRKTRKAVLGAETEDSQREVPPEPEDDSEWRD